MWNSDNHLLSYCVGIQDKGSVLQYFKSFLVRKKYVEEICRDSLPRYRRKTSKN